MRVGVGSSLMTHLAVLVMAQFGLPGSCASPQVAAQYVPVELVSSDDVAALLPPSAAPRARMPEPPALTAPEPRDGVAVDTPPRVEPVPPLAAAPPPAEPALVAPEPVAPEPGADGPTEAPPDVLATINAIAVDGAAPGGATQGAAARDLAAAAITPDERRDIEALKRAIIEQVSRCWSPPAGVPDADKMLVEVHVQFESSGALAGIAVYDAERMRRDITFRAAAEAAKRAFLNPRCNPLDLPADKYALWNEIIFTFNPSEMVN